MTRIVSTGAYIPEKKVTNGFFNKPENPEQLASIEKYMTGMRERHHANEQETGIFMGVKAALEAITDSPYEVQDIDMIIGNITPNQHLLPEDLNLLAQELGCTGADVLPINTACSSFLTSLNLARMFIKENKEKLILIINSTNWVNHIIDKSRDYSMVGDGAGAVLVDGKADSFIAMEQFSDSKVFHTMCMHSPVFTLKPEYFRVQEDKNIDMIEEQVRKPIDAAKNLLKKKDMVPDWFISHQAGVAMIEYWVDQLALNKKMIRHTFDLYANMMSANIPVTLNHYIRSGQIKRQDTLLLFAPAAGANYVSMLWHY